MESPTDMDLINVSLDAHKDTSLDHGYSVFSLADVTADDELIDFACAPDKGIQARRNRS